MLCRYITRPAVAEERLELQPSGDVLLRLKTPYSDGTSRLLFSGVEFVEKLAALIPPARIHLTRFFGCLAPHARIRAQVVPPPMQVPASRPPSGCRDMPLRPLRRPVGAPAEGSEDPPEPTPQRPARAQRWAELLARVFGLDTEKCEDCGGPIKIVSAILEPFAIKAILMHLRLPDKPPELAPARIPEQSQYAPAHLLQGPACGHRKAVRTQA
jgi:hypothetical protein